MTMTKEAIIENINSDYHMTLATVEGDQPHVRTMMLFRADEKGIVFHTASSKDVFKQIQANPKAELCFFNKGVQIRVKGIITVDADPELRAEIFAHPSRKFLQAWKSLKIDSLMTVLRLTKCEATCWNMESNFDPKEWVKISE